MRINADGFVRQCARLVLFPLVLAATACSSTPATSSSTSSLTGTENRNAARRATFNCDGTALTVVFAEETADIIWNAGTDTLEERPAESGVLYESQRNVLRGKGDEMTWILTGRSPRHCVAMR